MNDAMKRNRFLTSTLALGAALTVPHANSLNNATQLLIHLKNGLSS
jgi:hypothetical protein